MKPHRILIITNRVPYPLHDGGAMAMDAMIRGYHRAGMQVHVLAMNTVRHFVSEEKITELYPDIEGFTAVPFNNRLKPLSILLNLLTSSEPEHVQRFYTKAFEARLVEVLRDFGPDVIQMESLFLTSYLPAIKNHSKALLILRMHNVEHEIWGRFARESHGLKKQYLQLLASRMQRFERHIWPQYDLLLPITHTDAGAVRTTNARLSLLVAPFGITLKQQSALPARSFTRTYHVGAMDWMPNASAIGWLLREIWPAVKRAVPAASFHFAGRQMPERYHQHLPEGAVCYGEVPDIAAFYADKDVLLVPLRSGGGIRIKILEAMAAGKLVISTDTGMQGIEAVPGTHYLRANAPEDFAMALRWCNDLPGKAAQIAAAGQKMINMRYNRETIVAAIINWLDQQPERH